MFTYSTFKQSIECGWLHGLRITVCQMEMCPLPTADAIPAPEAEFSVILCTCIYLGLCHLRLTGGAPLCSLILVCVSQHRLLNAIGQKKAPPHSLAITREQIIGTERRDLVRPDCSTFEQYEPWTEPQLNLRRTWVCCAGILWNSRLCRWRTPYYRNNASSLATLNLHSLRPLRPAINNKR
jgi:hypothetical protein